MKITVEQKIKQIEKQYPWMKQSVNWNWLVKELKRHRAALNKICSNYYCNLDTLEDETSPYKDIECPTCLANKVLVKKVKK